MPAMVTTGRVSGLAGLVRSVRANRGGFAACAAAVWLAGCGHSGAASGDHTRPLVVAVVREPAAIFPPLVGESVGRDISDQIWERLADLLPGAPPTDSAAYRPRLAAAWERVDSLTWRFHLRRGARWQDGAPLTAEDVRFSFDAYTDSLVDSPARGALAGKVRVVVEDPATFLIRFAEASPEQLYDATYHVRVVPSHVWASLPPARWAEDTTVARLIGSGSYRIRTWKRGEFMLLEADSTAERRARIGRVLWRFTPDPDAAINLALSGEADLLEQVGPPSQQARFASDSAFELRPYPSAVYGFLAFRLQDSGGRRHPIFGRREVRRALTLAVDRQSMARALLGPGTKAPSGPMSGNLWIGSQGIQVLPFDVPMANHTLDSAGWHFAGAGRSRGGRPLRFDILVPSTSSVRKQAAVMLQEVWRRVGAEVTVTTVDFPVFEERIRRGEFDSYIGAYLDEPSPRGIADQFTRAGWDRLNFGRYANPRFDSLLASAGRERSVAGARRLYQEALDTINSDAPAVFLYTPNNVAAIRRTLAGVRLNPYSWLADLPDWEVRREGRAELGMR
jgi:peptide/nickel transport system substrate-binding protein